MLIHNLCTFSVNLKYFQSWIHYYALKKYLAANTVKLQCLTSKAYHSGKETGNSDTVWGEKLIKAKPELTQMLKWTNTH